MIRRFLTVFTLIVGAVAATGPAAFADTAEQAASVVSLDGKAVGPATFIGCSDGVRTCLVEGHSSTCVVAGTSAVGTTCTVTFSFGLKDCNPQAVMGNGSYAAGSLPPVPVTLTVAYKLASFTAVGVVLDRSGIAIGKLTVTGHSSCTVRNGEFAATFTHVGPLQ